MRYLFTLILATYTFISSAQEKPIGNANYFWGGFGGGLSSFESTSVNFNAHFKSAIKHHSFGVEARGYMTNFNPFCSGSAPELSTISATYGWLKQKPGYFYYVETGLSFLEYSFVSDTLPRGTSFCSSYKRSTTAYAGVPIEIGLGLHSKLLLFNPYVSLLVSTALPPIWGAGVKFGFGDFK